MALNPPDADVFEKDQGQESNSSAPCHDSNQASQSSCRLAEQYGISLNRHLMRTDALYAFSELFSISLCSENQFLNMLQSEISMVSRSFHGQEEACVDTLSYCKGLIDEHADRLRETLSLLENEENNGWPRATEAADIESREVLMKMIRKDCRYLLHRCSTLADRAVECATLVRNSTMLQASEKSISQAKEVGRLTLLAYFFLPLSFVTSLFGMNFVEFESWHDALVSGLCILFGVMSVALVVCFWEYMPWRKREKNL